jgi:hypothetical protein
MPGKKKENHNACLRVRSESAHGAAVWSCKTEDNMACLRGFCFQISLKLWTFFATFARFARNILAILSRF